jgi:hypothetical protein
VTAIGADRERDLTPLEMAQNCAAAVSRYASYQDRDPMGSYVSRAGQQGHATAELAGNLALVSIAEDLHRVVAIMTGEAADLLDAKWARDAEEKRGGAVDDARATREHMQRWAEGGETHKGETL